MLIQVLYFDSEVEIPTEGFLGQWKNNAVPWAALGLGGISGKKLMIVCV